MRNIIHAVLAKLTVKNMVDLCYSFNFKVVVPIAPLRCWVAVGYVVQNNRKIKRRVVGSTYSEKIEIKGFVCHSFPRRLFRVVFSVYMHQWLGTRKIAASL